MNSLTKLALKRPVSSLLIVLALVVFGINSLLGFKMELMPDMEMPMLFVMTYYAGGDPETTEELVTKVIEDEGKTLSGVDSIKSQTTSNVSFVMFSYEYGTDTDEAHSDLRSCIDTLKKDLPDDAQEPIIMEMNMDAQAVIAYSVTASGDTDVLAFVEDEIQPEIERLSDVARVEVTGGSEEYIKIQLDQQKMAQYGLTMDSVSKYIAATDFTIPVGSLDQGKQSISASATSKPEAVMELQDVPLITNKGQTIKLSDIAQVSMSNKEATSVNRYNGNDSIGISVSKAQSAGTVDVCKKVTEIVNKVAAKNPAINVEIEYDSSDSIQSSLLSVGETLLLGVLFSMLVLFLFFGDIKASLIVGSSMPISLLATLICMSFAGFSLNIVTMSSLVIAIGMMVDSSIVVLESCFRLKDKTPDFKDAALAGTSVVASSVVASTITTIVVYLPLSIMKGLSGQMFSQLGFTIIIAMIASLLVALTLIPIFFWKYKPKERKNTPVNKILAKVSSAYKNVLSHIMLKKKTVMCVAIALLILAFVLAGQLNVEMMEATGMDNVSVTVEQRNGTRLEIVDDNIQFIEQMFMEDENFDGCNVSISDSKATITGYRADNAKKSVPELVEEYNKQFSNITDMNVTVEAAGSSMNSMNSGSTVQIDISGDNLDDLKVASRQVQDAMLATPGVIKTTSDITSNATQIEVRIDPLKCMDVGLTASQVAGAMYNANSGKKAMDLTINAEEYEVRLEYPEDAYNEANKLMNLEVAATGGKTITVADVAELEYTDAPQSLIRNDGTYQVEIIAYTTEADKFTAQDAIKKAVSEMDFPEGVGETQTMMDEMMGDEFKALGNAIAAAVFLIFLVMAMQFESPRFSLMVMLSIPFSLIGSFFLLFITRSTLTMNALMGILMLVGIVVNNGILFVDTTNQLKSEMSLNEALMESGRIRLRPILMTTLTTILSMVPMVFATDENSRAMRGMALIIIGGLIASTVLILLLLPSFYLLMDKQGRREAKERKKEKRAARKEKREAKKALKTEAKKEENKNETDEK